MLRPLLRYIPGARALRTAQRRLTRGRRRRRRVLALPSYLTTNARKKIRLDQAVPGFSEIANETIGERRTFLSHDRLHTLWQGLEATSDGSIIVEVGVRRGGSVRFLSRAARWLGRDVHVYACDTFDGVLPGSVQPSGARRRDDHRR